MTQPTDYDDQKAPCGTTSEPHYARCTRVLSSIRGDLAAATSKGFPLAAQRSRRMPVPTPHLTERAVSQYLKRFSKIAVILSFRHQNQFNLKGCILHTSVRQAGRFFVSNYSTPALAITGNKNC